MSFISILKTIGKDIAGVEPIAVTVLKLFPITAGPAALVDDLYHRLTGAIVTAEAAGPPTGGGQLKSSSVVTDFEAGLSVTQQVLALEHKHLVYDDAKLQAAIDAQVAALNAFADLKSTFKVEDLPKP